MAVHLQEGPARAGQGADRFAIVVIATSQAFGMPRSAIETGCVDRVLPIDEIAPALLRLVAPEAAA